jgi:hypothetical protein
MVHLLYVGWEWRCLVVADDEHPNRDRVARSAVACAVF